LNICEVLFRRAEMRAMEGHFVAQLVEFIVFQVLKQCAFREA